MAKRRTARRAADPRKRAGMLPGEAKRQSLVTVERVAKMGEMGLMAPDHYIVKQVMEALHDAYEALTDRTGDYLAVMDVVAERVEEAQDAARKAGLTA